MTNKEKAQKLAEEHENATSFGIESPYHAALGAAIDMAEWKDRQLRQILDDIRSEAERCIFTYKFRERFHLSRWNMKRNQLL